MGKKAIEAAAQTGARPKRRKRRLRRLIGWLLLVAVLLAAVALGYLSLKNKYTVTYDTYTASTGTISNALSFSGALQAVNNESYNAPGDCTVRNVYVQRGQNVKAGDALLRLSNGKVIEAGIDGTVNQLPVREGDEAASGDLLAQVVDFTHMQVSFRVDEYDIADVHEGDACRVTATATEKTFNSVIDNINYVSASSGSVAYYTATAYVEVEPGVYPGMQATVTVPQEEASDVVILKEEALSFDRNNQAFVYQMNGEGALEAVPVETGVSNGNYVEIKSGLQSGDTVYVEAQSEQTPSLLSTLFGGQRFNQNMRQSPGNNNVEMRVTNIDGGDGMVYYNFNGGGRP